MTVSEIDSLITDYSVAGDVRDPYPEFVTLRRDNPVVRHEPYVPGGSPMVVVYRHADVTKVLRDNVTFSSAIMRDVMGEVMGQKIILAMDEPEHYRHADQQQLSASRQ